MLLLAAYSLTCAYAGTFHAPTTEAHKGGGHGEVCFKPHSHQGEGEDSDSHGGHKVGAASVFVSSMYLRQIKRSYIWEPVEHMTVKSDPVRSRLP